MTRNGPTPTQVARILRQRQELGAGPLVLGGLSREEVLAATRERGGGLAGKGDSLGKGDPVSQGDPVGQGDPAGALPTSGVSPSPGTARETRPRAVGSVAQTPAPGPLPTIYDELRDAALNCTRCRLAEGRTQVVFSDGNPAARLMVVGEAPGAHEDRTGLPFVGPAGKLLDLLLASIDLSRETSVYICNVLKCRPPANRNPRPDEIESCSPYLLRQIELVRPEAILAVGTFAGQLLTASDKPLGKLRGEVYSYQGIPLVVTYHPAALLRNSGWIRPTWGDLQLLRQLLDAPARMSET